MNNNELKLAKVNNNNVIQVSNSILIHLTNLAKEYVEETKQNKKETAAILAECRKIKNSLGDEVVLTLDSHEEFILTLLENSNIIEL